MTEERALYEVHQATHDDEFLSRLAAFMQSHRGARNAIKGKRLAQEFGFKNDRAIRAAFAKLAERGILIASSVHEPFGFYLVESQGEAEQYERTLNSRAVKILKHIRDFSLGKRMRFGPAQQLRLRLVDEMIQELDQRKRQA